MVAEVEQQQVCWIELATLHESCVTQEQTERPSIPTWSPDGQWLAYYVDEESEFRIDVVNVADMQRKTIVVFTSE
jgi:Tol biopolymer transport system component